MIEFVFCIIAIAALVIAWFVLGKIDTGYTPQSQRMTKEQWIETIGEALVWIVGFIVLVILVALLG